MTAWSPISWQDRPSLQQPTYPDPEALRAAAEALAKLPPLVTSWEVETLRGQIVEAQQGKRFLLQGGDCAERFDECEALAITSRLKILLQMSLVLAHGLQKRVIRVGRFAGQYAKPRSADTEDRDGRTLPTYRGDGINAPKFDEASRTPDPARLVRAYERSALCLNFIRSLVDGGFADLHHPEYWNLDFVQHARRGAAYQRTVESIGQSLQFMESLSGIAVKDLSRVDFYTSHEGLHLVYESAQTRRVPRREGWWNLSTHFPWIGARTADPDGAHVEYFRGIRNPIAVKVGPDREPGERRAWLEPLLDRLDPDREPGRVTLIHRFGVEGVAEHLPALVEAVGALERTVLFVCDPMHGNTRRTDDGVKTRRFDDILGELEQAFAIHASLGTHIGGLHVEVTGEDVTECTGGARGLQDADLGRAYRSTVDPRLNYEQSLELAMRVAELGGGGSSS